MGQLFGDVYSPRKKNQHCHFNDLKIGDKKIDKIGNDCAETTFKFLGHVLDENLNFEGHINHIMKKLLRANYALSTSKNFVPLNIRKTIYHSLFESHLNFGSIIWGCAQPKQIKKLSTLQKKAVRLISGKKQKCHTSNIFKELKLLNIFDLISLNQAMYIRKYKNKQLPESFFNIYSSITDKPDIRRTRDDDYNLIYDMPLKKEYLSFPSLKCINTFNSLDITLKSMSDVKKIKYDFLSHCFLRNDTECVRENCFSCNQTS